MLPSSTPQLQHPSYYGSVHPGPVTHNLSLMRSEPALNRHASFDQASLGMNPYTPTGSYTDIAMASSPLPPQDPVYTNLLDPLYRHERSRSLGNIHLMAQNSR